MNRKLSLVILATASLVSAQVSVKVFLPPPPIITIAPPIIEVTPGISVVRDSPDETFFVENSYWMMHNGHWYRSYGPKKSWILMRESRVPRQVMRMPRGKYRNWHPEERVIVRRNDDRQDRKEDKHHWQEHTRVIVRDEDRKREEDKHYDRKDEKGQEDTRHEKREHKHNNGE